VKIVSPQYAGVEGSCDLWCQPDAGILLLNWMVEVADLFFQFEFLSLLIDFYSWNFKCQRVCSRGTYTFFSFLFLLSFGPPPLANIERDSRIAKVSMWISSQSGRIGPPLGMGMVFLSFSQKVEIKKNIVLKKKSRCGAFFHHHLLPFLSSRLFTNEDRPMLDFMIPYDTVVKSAT
jgi:hypothetical protein